MATHGAERAKALLKSYGEELVKDKFFCHIGCSDGDFLWEISKHARCVLGIECESQPAKTAMQRQYECPATILNCDAHAYLKENQNVNPEVFYYWAGHRKKKSGMQWWLEKIIKSQGKTNSTVIAGISLMARTSPNESGRNDGSFGRQIITAYDIQKIYGGDIYSTTYNTDQFFGYYVVNLDGHTIDINRAAPDIDRIEYDRRKNLGIGFGEKSRSPGIYYDDLSSKEIEKIIEEIDIKFSSERQ